MSTTGRGRNPQYEYNPTCRCSWCANAGKPPEGRWINSPFYGRVYDMGPNDGYADPHMPPRSYAMTSQRVERR